MYNSAATHKTTITVRRYIAVDIEIPIPVQIAKYAARHAGHFGNSARMPPGAITLAASRQRCATVGGRRPLMAIRAPAVTRLESPEILSQQV